MHRSATYGTGSFYAPSVAYAAAMLRRAGALSLHWLPAVLEFLTSRCWRRRLQPDDSGPTLRAAALERRGLACDGGGFYLRRR